MSYKENPEEYYPKGYLGPSDPHMSMVRHGKKWICTDCGKIGDDLIYKSGCTHEHQPCKYCGCAPVCALDCKGVLNALDSDDVYIAGVVQNGKPKD